MLKRFHLFLHPVTIKISYRSHSISANRSPIMASSSQTPNPQHQKFDYLLVLDFEATCDQGVAQPIPQEIIEFPVMKIDTRTWEIHSQFHQYVRPVEHPVLTSFCTNLTGIVQDMIDDQPNLEETLRSFDQWLRSEGLSGGDDQKSSDQSSDSQKPGDHSIAQRSISIDQSSDHDFPTWAFVTCGDWDLKSMLRRQCDHFGYPRPQYFRRWINLKKIYFQQFKIFPKGMTQMLQELNLRHEGRHHSGIDDVRNIAQIVRTLGLRGVKFDLTGSES